ncbi:MAG TPA: tetratricopeptide repeat protein [Tepidisphaeraceae bacterium]|nr:tetratricopeptide repeat protein [Tepidisphaeraceae bacterium]
MTSSRTLQTAANLHRAGRVVEAEKMCRDVLAQSPDQADAWHLLGLLEQQTGRAAQAEQSIRRAIHLNPAGANYHCNLALVLAGQGRMEEALAELQTAVKLEPRLSEAHNNIGNLLKERGQLDQAIAAYRSALEANESNRQAWHNLGDALRELGRLDESIAAYQRALAIGATAATGSSLVFTLNFHPGYDANAVLQAHRAWDRQFAQPLKPQIRPHDHDRNPDRRLRIGYVSPDFRRHVTAFNLMPLLREHDRSQVEVFCYSDVAAPDAYTDRIRSYSSCWRDVRLLDDQRLTELVRTDRIDILVDTTMHMPRNRLLMFARKPAPVQVTLAYPATTGLEAMDYRLTDPFLDPPACDERGRIGENDQYYSEKTIRLPHSFWCYDPENEQPAVGSLPCTSNGFITFGCLNNFMKVNAGVLDLWAATMRAAPESRLLLLCRQGSARQDAGTYPAGRGITSDRVEFVDYLPREQYLEVYNRIDVGLDTFPYSGHTTSLDSFWMGVPVVTLVRGPAAGRAGWSQLSNLELSELAAHTEEQFVQIATELASNRDRLASLRASLRDRMKRSSIMDAKGYARGVEAAYRTMWRTWATAVQQSR